MRIHLAIGSTKPHWNLFIEEKVQHILFSYAYINSPENYLKVSQGYFPKVLIIDSGAFTVWTKGSQIDIDKYAQFCKDIKAITPNTTELHYVNLDVLPGKFGQMPTEKERIKSAEKGVINAKYLISKGLDIIPVFHQHEPFEFLNKMAQEFEYFGISPANDVGIKEKDIWLEKVFSKLKKTRKTHGFGVTSIKLLKKYPFYSVDSSAWNVGSRYARIPSFNDYHNVTVHFKNKVEFLRNWDKFIIKDSKLLTENLLRLRAGIRSYQKMEQEITLLWEQERNLSWI